MDRSSNPALAYCLVLSGGAALIYEVVWLRQVSLVMGHTALALAALLTAFLGGLALGSILAGRLADRVKASDRLYAGIEVGVALSALLVPIAVGLLGPAFGLAYRTLSHTPLGLGAAQLLLSCIALVIPCTLMGMTLPIVVSATTSSGGTIAGGVGRLYALNSIGGVLGAGAAGLLLIPQLGESGTLWVAAALNGLAALFAFLTSFEDIEIEAKPPKLPTPGPQLSDAWPAPSAGLLSLLYGLAGFSSLALQVGWARVVTLSVGSTSYGFTITLVSFITGISAGSAWGKKISWLRRSPVRALFVLHVTIGLCTLITLPWLGALPERVASLMGSQLSFTQLWWAQLGLVFTTIVIPTLAMGAIFPVVAELLRAQGLSSGRAVGTAYAANTIGNILGAALAGFVLMGALGMRGTIVASAILSVGIGIIYLRPRKGPALVLASGLLLGTMLAAWALPQWDRDIVATGPFLRGYQGQRSGSKAGKLMGELTDYVEGPTTVAAVRDRGDLKQLYVGGIAEASSVSPMHRYLAHQGLLLHGDAKKVLLIGLGTGRTLGAIMQYPVEQVDCMEISPEVVELAERHFSEGISLAFEDPRVDIQVQDGRNHLQHSGQRYDVIISQPSYPWAAGAARLFTREYFELIQAALTPNGVAVIWFPSRFDAGARSILKAWNEVFEHPHLFAPDSRYQFFFAVGFGAEASLDTRRIQAALQYPRVLRAASMAGLGTAKDVLKAEQPWPDTRDVPANTDDNGFVEHAAFRDLMDQRRKLP